MRAWQEAGWAAETIFQHLQILSTVPCNPWELPGAPEISGTSFLYDADYSHGALLDVR